MIGIIHSHLIKRFEIIGFKPFYFKSNDLKLFQACAVIWHRLALFLQRNPKTLQS